MSPLYCSTTCGPPQYTKANAGNWINRLMAFEGKQAVCIKPDTEWSAVLQQPACSQWSRNGLLTTRVHLSTKAALWGCHGTIWGKDAPSLFPTERGRGVRQMCEFAHVVGSSRANTGLWWKNVDQSGSVVLFQQNEFDVVCLKVCLPFN